MSTRTRAGLVVAVVAGSTLLYLGILQARKAAYIARLPVLPDLSAQPPAVRGHLTDADRVARRLPISVDRVWALGLAYHADMFYEQAERTYTIAEELGGSTWERTYFHALVHDARGDEEALAAALRRVVAAAPQAGQAWWRLGEVEFKAGHLDAAADAWRRVPPIAENPRPAVPGSPARVPSAPMSAYAALGLARLAIVQGDPDAARKLLEDVTAKTPSFGPAFRLLGTAYAALGRSEDAARSVRVADRSPAYDPYVDPMIDTLVRESRSSTFLLQQAATADLTINASWREYLIRRALEYDPDNPDALYELASVLRVLRRFDEALALLERHRRLAPGDFQALADSGRCLSGLKRFSEAEPVLRQALAGLDDANTRYDLGFALDRQDRTGEAIVEYQRALERNPNHADASNNLGVALARQGRLREAALQFARVVAIDPDNADAHTNLGAILLSQGADERAAQEFEEALRINPNLVRARDGLERIRR